MFSRSKKLNNKKEQRCDLLTDKYAPFNNVQLNVWKEALLFAIGNAFVLSLIATIVGAMLVNMNDIDKKGAMMLISYSILFVFLVLIVRTDIKPLLSKFKNWVPYVVGIAFGLTILLLSEGYMRFVNLFINTGVGGNEAGIRAIIARYPVASIFIFGLIGPVCEELTYRMGVFNLIKRWHRVPAYIFTGLLFGIIHMDFTGNIALEFIVLPNYIMPGVLLCVAYDLFDLPCSYTAHVTNNLAVILTQVIVINS